MFLCQIYNILKFWLIDIREERLNSDTTQTKLELDLNVKLKLGEKGYKCISEENKCSFIADSKRFLPQEY